MTSSTWMIDGKPGQILALMAAAIKEAPSLEKTHDRKAGMDYLSVDAIKQATRNALSKHGIVTQWETVGEPLIDTGKAPFTVVTVRCLFIAPDGSYLVSEIKGGGQAGMGRSLTVAVTAAVKQILGLTLQLATGDDDANKEPQADPDAWSADLQTVVGAFRAATSHDELRELAAMDENKRLGPKEIAIARHFWKERSNELALLETRKGPVDFDEFERGRKVRK